MSGYRIARNVHSAKVQVSFFCKIHKIASTSLLWVICELCDTDAYCTSYFAGVCFNQKVIPIWMQVASGTKVQYGAHSGDKSSSSINYQTISRALCKQSENKSLWNSSKSKMNKKDTQITFHISKLLLMTTKMKKTTPYLITGT